MVPKEKKMNVTNAHFMNGENYVKYNPAFVGFDTKNEINLPEYICEVCGAINHKRIVVDVLMKSIDKRLTLQNECVHCHAPMPIRFNGPELSKIIFEHRIMKM
jgi:hypothetical protein